MQTTPPFWQKLLLGVLSVLLTAYGLSWLGIDRDGRQTAINPVPPLAPTEESHSAPTALKGHASAKGRQQTSTDLQPPPTITITSAIVSGRVFSQEDEQPLRGVKVLMEGFLEASFSDASGFFEFIVPATMPKGEYTLEYYIEGFSPKRITYFEIPKTNIREYLIPTTK